MKVLLLAGYDSSLHSALSPAEAGGIRLDAHIRKLEALKYEVVVIAGGHGSEDLLRQSKALERCDLVFDTHDAEATLITNLRAGLHVTEEATFILPVTVDVPEQNHFHQMITAYYQAGLRTTNHGYWFHDYPLLVTRAGNQFFRKAADLKDFSDPLLSLVRLEDGKLASRVNAL